MKNNMFMLQFGEEDQTFPEEELKIDSDIDQQVTRNDMNL